MLIIGLYHPPRFQYDESDLIDTIINRCDTFLDMHPNGVLLCGGDPIRSGLSFHFILPGAHGEFRH